MKYYIFGAGMLGREMLIVLNKYGCMASFIDNNTDKQGIKIEGFDVISLDQYLQLRDWQIIVAVSIPVLYNFILPEHAKKRIDIFLNPESDPRGSGYNIIQSKLAIGAGQLTGMGLLKGNQTQLRIFISKNYWLYIFSNTEKKWDLLQDQQ